jgi:hypothetical protein
LLQKKIMFVVRGCNQRHLPLRKDSTRSYNIKLLARIVSLNTSNQAHRQIKQMFHLEQIMLRSYQRLKTMSVLLMMASALIMMFVEHDCSLIIRERKNFGVIKYFNNAINLFLK